MSNGKSFFIMVALLGVVGASGLWLYRFYNVVPVGPGDEKARALGFTSSKRYSDINSLGRNAKPRQSFNNSQFALVEDVMSNPRDSMMAKISAVIPLMTIQPTEQRIRAIELMARHVGKDKVLDNSYRSIMSVRPAGCLREK